MVKKMARNILTSFCLSLIILSTSALEVNQVSGDIVGGLATQDLFLGAMVGRRASVDSNQFDIPNEDRPTGGSGTVSLNESFSVGPVEAGGTFFLPGTTAEASVAGTSLTVFNSSSDISVEVSASSSLLGIDPSGIPGSYGANAQAYSFFSFTVDEIEEYSIFGTLATNSNTSSWQVRLSGGAEGFVFNRLTNAGSGTVDFSGTALLRPGFDYVLRANTSTSLTLSDGAAAASRFDGINFRFRPSAVPEPGSISFLALGAVVIGLRRRRS